MATLHQKLAVVLVLGTLLGTLWSGYRAYKGGGGGRLRTYGVVIVLAIALQGVAGTVLGLTGQRPGDPWHLLFGPLTLLALPVTLLAEPRLGRSRGGVVFLGWLITFVLTLRATGTGGLGR